MDGIPDVKYEIQRIQTPNLQDISLNGNSEAQPVNSNLNNFHQHRLTTLTIQLLLATLIVILSTLASQAQSESPCIPETSKRVMKVFDKAVRAYRNNQNTLCIQLCNESLDMDPDFVDAYFLLGLIYVDKKNLKANAAKENFAQVVKLCPSYDIYTWFYLSQLSYGAREYDSAYHYIQKFLEDVDQIKTDEDYDEAVKILDYSKFYIDIFAHPVPFDPKPVEGISTSMDEYLPIISPDDEMALFTRKIKVPPRRDDLTPQVRYKEKFIFSLRNQGKFEEGEMMPQPFNRNDNEGGATLTIDNKELFYTLCQFAKGKRYYNCDICTSTYQNGNWSEISKLGGGVNLPNSWESQPSVTSDGNRLFFVSDRAGGLGGYDIYTAQRDSSGQWGQVENLGAPVNTAGNEKSPFIHTDSQTLYFSSDGHMGIGGYDIFYSKLNKNKHWGKPVNIGYPINSYDDDVGFFVSTSGRYGYFASNKFEGKGGWDLYYFDLYEQARPEKVLFIKGQLIVDTNSSFLNTRIELKNTANNSITQVPVDTLTGKYVAAVLFRNDYIMTVKKKGYVNETKYLDHIKPRNSLPLNIISNLQPIEVGTSYRLNDIYFDFNSIELPPESKAVLAEFYTFLIDNPSLKISIEGHTDNIGSESDNLILSTKRAKAVYDYLIEKGIPTKRLRYKGWGESKAVASNSTEEGRAKNRRTEFVILEK